MYPAKSAMIRLVSLWFQRASYASFSYLDLLVLQHLKSHSVSVFLLTAGILAAIFASDCHILELCYYFKGHGVA